MIVLDIFKIIHIVAAFDLAAAGFCFETIPVHHFYPDRFFLIFEFHLHYEFNIIIFGVLHVFFLIH